MIRLSVNVKDSASPALAAVISALTGPEAAGLNAVGGRSASNAAASYHRTFDQSGGWRGKRYLGPSQTDGSRFGADVARGWKFDSSDKQGAIISNDADHYRFKITGGTITPKRWRYLTIPLVPEAKGLRAATYVQNTGLKLFQPRGKRVLAVKDGKGIRPIYALVSSVTMGPWPNALPPEELLTDHFLSGWRDALEAHIEDA